MSTIPQRKIIIRRSLRQLELHEDNKLIAVYPLCRRKKLNANSIRELCHCYKNNEPRGAFGTRWLGLTLPEYGIHGTNKPASIGTQASLGCIRMHNHHVEALYDLVGVGTPVIIIE